MFMSKLYLRETTLFLQGCTIFTVFVTAPICFEELKAFKELKIYPQTTNSTTRQNILMMKTQI
jgi:hypothetical protein